MKHGRLLIGGLSLSIVLVAAGGWALAIQPLLSSASASEAELESVVQVNQLQSDRLAQLEEQGADIRSIREDREALEDAIPAQAATGKLVGELSDIAGRAGVRVTAVTPGAPVSLVAATAVAASTDDETEDEDASAPAAGAASVDVPGMLTMPVTISATGSQQGVSDFVASLQGDGRLISIATLTISMDSSTQQYRVDVVGHAYILPA